MRDPGYDESQVDDVFRVLCRKWLEKIEHAKTHKHKVFGQDAATAQAFYSGPKDWDTLMAGGPGITKGGDGFPNPTFKVSVNKTFEFVTIFGPALYYENPVRTIKPRTPVVIPPDFYPDPLYYEALIQQEEIRVMVDGLRALLLGAYLNWTPVLGLSDQSRLAIDEALIKGRGVLWTELDAAPDSDFKTVRSSYDSVDHLLVDPDAPSFDQATWIARKCIHPTWQVERDYGLRPGSVKGNLESQAKQSDLENDEDGQYDRKRGLTNDLLRYWKVYSKMGIGGRLAGVDRRWREPLDIFGDYCYLVIADNCDYPLNLPPDVVSDPAFQADPSKVYARVAWPTPFWANRANRADWPCSVLDFHSVHNSPWPMAHLKAGMGELKAINWVFSFMMGKIKTTCRDLIAMKKSLPEEMKNTVLHGCDLEVLELEADHETIETLIQVLQMPSVNGDIWTILEALEKNFDKRVGLTELMYGAGGATQIRSAQESQIRNQNMNVRPQDMAKQVESWQAAVAAKEGIAARYHLLTTDVEHVLGPMAAQAWAQYVASRDLSVVCHQLEYHIEAGSTQRPNKDFEVQQMSAAFQALSPLLENYANTTGDQVPLNNLLADFAKSRDLDPARYQLRAAMPPPQAPVPQDPSGGVQQTPTDNPLPQG